MKDSVHLDILRDIRIASPCTVPWQDMAGDHKIRHCAQCDLDVHNLAEMTRDEIERLVLGANGRVCGRLFKRADGRVLTRDCPVGLAAVRAKTRRTAARVVALASLLFSASMLYASGERDAWNRGKLVRYQPFKWAYEKLGPQPVQSMTLMSGDFSLPVLRANPPASGITGSSGTPGTPTP